MGTPSKGDEVWLSDGSRAVYIDQTSRGTHLVHPIFENDDGEPWESTEIATVSEVHVAEPIPAISAAVKALTAQRDQLLAEIDKARKDKWGAESEHRRVLDSLKRFEPFAQIEMIMDGRATHMGTCHYTSGVSIKRLKAGETDRWGDKPARHIEMEASYDHSGTPKGSMRLKAKDICYSNPTFFETEEAAKAWGTEQLSGLIRAFRSEAERGSAELPRRAEGISASCHALSVDVPADVHALLLRQQITKVREEKARAEKVFAAYQKAEQDAVAALEALPSTTSTKAA